jgi:DtxR family Mn-dependent transcriptional regulator
LIKIKKVTFAEENYLKAIFHLAKQYKEGVPTNAIADSLGAKASSVTDMLKKLANQQLVKYKKYQGALLSDKGRDEAVYIIRKHRLWECFLYEKLDFNWDEVHDIAEQLEHIKSEKLVNKLEEFLGFPTVDPHGDPIPDRNGNIAAIKHTPLSKITRGSNVVLVSVKDSSDDFLKYLSNKEIAIGKKIKVLYIEEFDKSMRIKIGGQEDLVTETVARNLLVRKI